MSDELDFRTFDAPAGERLDVAIAQALALSRTYAKSLVDDGYVMLDGRPVGKPATKLSGAEVVTVMLPPPRPLDVEPEDVPVGIIYEDLDMAVIDKPPGMVAHPTATVRTGTVVNALLGRMPLSKEKLQDPTDEAYRPGIVHRLDKDTSGLMVVAKTLQAHQDLVAQLQARSVSRRYEATAQGVPTAGGTVDAPLGRHPTLRQKRAVSEGSDAREAITHYRVLQRFRHFSHLRLQLETGRTHQIRVHMAHIGLPLVGDPQYGGRLRLPAGADPELLDCLRNFRRQALHARALEFIHPRSGEPVGWESPLPEDMRQLLDLLARDVD